MSCLLSKDGYQWGKYDFNTALTSSYISRSENYTSLAASIFYSNFIFFHWDYVALFLRIFWVYYSFWSFNNENLFHNSKKWFSSFCTILTVTSSVYGVKSEANTSLIYL